MLRLLPAALGGGLRLTLRRRHAGRRRYDLARTRQRARRNRVFASSVRRAINQRHDNTAACGRSDRCPYEHDANRAHEAGRGGQLAPLRMEEAGNAHCGLLEVDLPAASSP
jgi:hypothetical protein